MIAAMCLAVVCAGLYFKADRAESKLKAATVELGKVQAALIAKDGAIAAQKASIASADKILSERDDFTRHVMQSAFDTALTIQGVKDEGLDARVPTSVSDSLHSLYSKAASGACATRGDAGTAVRAVSAKTASSATD